jgi:radical SAM superfamily enzyme YgiQ (UPF0313 family)
MKVMLIQPPMFHLAVNIAPNIGLAYIAAVLERDGIEVKVVDAAAENLKYDHIIDRVRDFQPDIIGAGGQTPVSPRTLTIFRKVKHTVSPAIITIAGGPHFSFTDQESLEACPELDIVVRGEGEATMSELCKKLGAGESLQGVSGITWRSADGAVITNPDREPISNLDALPLPAWHLFPVRNYHWAGIPVLATTSVRGCPYRCPYCITWKLHQGVRRRDPAQIVAEMVWAKRNFQHDTFFFHDDASFLIREHLEGFLEALERCGEKLFWYYETREDVFLSYRDLWPRMKKNGLFKIVFGLEHPDPETRALCGKKGFDHNVVIAMLDTLEKQLDIIVSIYLLFNMYGETEDSMTRNLRYGKSLYPDHCSFVVGSTTVPFPGTEMFKEMKQLDLLTTYNWNDYGFDKSVFKTGVSPQRLSEIFTGFWVDTYVRPKVFMKQLRFYLSKSRFRRAMAKQYVKMAIAMISDTKKLGKDDSRFESD